MTSAIGSSTVIEQTATRAVLETAPRRQLQAELTEIRHEIDRFKDQIQTLGIENDALQEVEQWHRNFSDTLNRLNSDPQRILQTYASGLQGILIDPITCHPLDEQAVLGMDGKTYGYKHLSLYLFSLSEEQRYDRSPLDPENSIRFSTVEHTLARHMIQWLKRHNAYVAPESIAREYDRILERNREIAYIVPNTRNDRIRSIIRINERRTATQPYQQQAQQLAEYGMQLGQRIEFLQGEIRDWQEETNERLDSFAGGQQAVMDQLRRQTETLEEEIEQNTGDIQNLQDQINSLDDDVEEAKKDDLELKKKTKELEREIKKKQLESKRNIIKVAVAATACIAASYFLPLVFSVTAEGGSIAVEVTLTL